MLVVEGTYENGQLQLDTPITYQRPVRVRVEFLDAPQMAQTDKPRFSWDEALALTVGSAGVSLSDAVIEERREGE